MGGAALVSDFNFQLSSAICLATLHWMSSGSTIDSHYPSNYVYIIYDIVDFVHVSKYSVLEDDYSGKSLFLHLQD
jgi:hypothetical protein